jgi:hypothetical protein
VPLIAPNHSFAGIPWWKNLDNIMKDILKDNQFKNSDYLLATPDKTRTKILPQPSTYSKALNWLRAILRQQQVHTTYINQTALHSLRLWMAEAAFQQNLPRELRRYCGRWANENTADVYTRDHRGVIHNIWRQVTSALKTTMEMDNEVPIESSDVHYDLDDLSQIVRSADLDPGVPSLPATNNVLAMDNYPSHKV